jgi:hypothetical protein
VLLVLGLPADFPLPQAARATSAATAIEDVRTVVKESDPAAE